MTIKINLLILSSALLSPASALGAATPAPPQWDLRSQVPGGPICAVGRRGDTVDTQILRPRADKLLLVAGHPDWNYSGGSLKVALSIDKGLPVLVTGQPLGNVMIVMVEDVSLEAKIKAAHTIHWGLPWGQFTADVDGISEAFEQLAICRDLVQ